MKQHTNRYYIFKRTCNRRLSKLQNITTSYVPTSDLFTKRWPNQKNSYWMNACRQNAVSNGSTSRNACKQIMCWGTEEELVCVPRQQSWAQNASIKEQTHDGCPSRTYRHASGHEPIEMWNSTNAYWPRIRNDIQDFLAACTKCQQNKKNRRAPQGLYRA